METNISRVGVRLRAKATILLLFSRKSHKAQTKVDFVILSELGSFEYGRNNRKTSFAADEGADSLAGRSSGRRHAAEFVSFRRRERIEGSFFA
jgi:hypothetical protein